MYPQFVMNGGHMYVHAFVLITMPLSKSATQQHTFSPECKDGPQKKLNFALSNHDGFLVFVQPHQFLTFILHPMVKMLRVITSFRPLKS